MSVDCAASRFLISWTKFEYRCDSVVAAHMQTQNDR
jgi:hypothetical protein